MEKLHLVSTNLKTNWSVNFPIHRTCMPTPMCKKLCYARKGRLSFSSSLDRQERVYQVFKNKDPGRIAEEIAKGCNRRNLSFLRWCGSGDLFYEAVIVLNKVIKQTPNTNHWVVTRKPQIVPLISAAKNTYLMFSLDGTESSKKRKEKVDKMLHPRMYYSFMRQEKDEDTMGATIVFNLQQKKGKLPYDNPKKVCPVDANVLPIKGACEKCRMCFSPKSLERR